MTRIRPDESASARRTWLVFALGPYLMCASALDVEGIIQCPEAIAKLPLTPDYALGAFLFRGRSAAAISLRRKLRLGQGQDLRTGPFVVTRIGDALVAFWVDEVRDVIEEKDAAWRPMPSSLGDGLFERFAIRESQLILQTRFSALRDARVEFESLAARVALQVDPNLLAIADAAPQAAGTAAALPADRRWPGSESPQPPAREVKNEQAETRGLPSAAQADPVLPRQHPVTPKRHSTLSGAAQSVRAPAKVRFAGERLRAHSPRSPATTPGTVPRPPAPLPTGVDPVSAPGPGSSRRRLAVPLAIGICVSAAAVYQFLPAPANDERSRSAAAISTPAAQPWANQVVSTEPDRLTLVVEHRGDTLTTGQAADDAGGSSAASTTRVHIVVKGDTLWQIAEQQVGDPFRYPELAKLSKIRDPNLIHPGDAVRIEIRKKR